MPKINYTARLVIYGLQDMSVKEYRRLLKWLEARFEEAQKPGYVKGKYSNRYISRLMK